MCHNNQVDSSPLLGTMVRAVQADGRGYGRFSQGKLELKVYKGSIYHFSVLVMKIDNLQIEAEEFPEISLKYEVVAVPTFLLFKVSYHLF